MKWDWLCSSGSFIKRTMTSQYAVFHRESKSAIRIALSCLEKSYGCSNEVGRASHGQFDPAKLNIAWSKLCFPGVLRTFANYGHKKVYNIGSSTTVPSSLLSMRKTKAYKIKIWLRVVEM